MLRDLGVPETLRVQVVQLFKATIHRTYTLP